MPKTTPALNEEEVANLTEPGCYHVGGVSGLILNVSAKSKKWHLRAQKDGKRIQKFLANYPEMPLDAARHKAHYIKHHLVQRKDLDLTVTIRVRNNERGVGLWQEAAKLCGQPLGTWCRLMLDRAAAYHLSKDKTQD